MNGKIVAWEDATIHISTHALHYGTGVFEGIRAYDTPRGPGIFRLTDHLVRFVRSAEAYRMTLPYSLKELGDAAWQLLELNELEACYIRPIAWRGDVQLGLDPIPNPVETAVLVWPWGTYHGDAAQTEGIKAIIAKTQRFDSSVLPTHAKASGHYLNSILARLEADDAGVGEAIMLGSRGQVAEGSAENVFAVFDGEIVTPPLSDGILPGITRDTALQLAHSLGIKATEQSMTPADLERADEIFMTGTAAEITPVRQLGEVEYSIPGPITTQIQQLYMETVRGGDTPLAQYVEYARPTTDVATQAV
jgi:branched-chain amino acid aminotransferase